MKLRDLIRYNIPESIINAWQSRQGDYLLPLQEKAIREGLLNISDNEQSPNLLISAPTSSGKSFCGELAAVASLLKRQKAIMLLPLKSIAEEKYNYFKKCYGDIGIRVVIATGDHPENDTDLELGNFDLALAIYEKFNHLLTVNLDVLQQIGLIVIDELQMIGEPHRGCRLETALIKTLSSGYNPRLIAISAVIDDCPELADWLNCKVVAETVRPVDLYQGVATGGYFHFRSFNNGHEGKEQIALANDQDNLTESLIDFLKSGKNQKLVFLKSRRSTIDAAFKLASVSGWPEARTTLSELESEETSFLIRSLRQTLSHGVAFHNADLTPTQRNAIEYGYCIGEIRVIFSTTTLAMGVNLPAETVLLETMKYSAGNFGGKPILVPITGAEFQNITGRAGRFGFGAKNRPGKAVVLAESDFEFEVLWSGYIDTQRKEKLVSILTDYDLADIILDLLVCGLGHDINQLEKNLTNSLYYRQGNKINTEQFESIRQQLVSDNFITESFHPTALGEAIAESGISIRSGKHYLNLLEKKYPQDLFEWLFLALFGSEFDVSRAGLGVMEYRGRVYEKLLFRDYSEYINKISFYTDFKIGREPLDFNFSAHLKALFLLSDWADGLPVESLEQRYQLHHGQIINLAEMTAWLLASLGRVIYAVDCNSSIPRHLEDLSFKVQFGINPEMKEIYFSSGSILNRIDIKRLENNGIISLVALQETDKKLLAEIIKPAGKAESLFGEIKNSNKEDKMQKKMRSYDVGRTHSLSYDSPTFVELDGSYEKERYLVKIDGFPVRLTGKSFKYLAKLASFRILNNEGWIYKDDIEIGFNQARYLYRLKQEIKNGGISWPIFENNRLGYYRLDLEPSKIRLNIDNFKSHPDFELRQIADQIALRVAG